MYLENYIAVRRLQVYLASQNPSPEGRKEEEVKLTPLGKFIAIVVVLLALGLVYRGYRHRKPVTVPPKQVQAFKPDLPPVDFDRLIEGRDQVVYFVVADPIRAAKLVTGKYAATIVKVSRKYAVPRRILEGVIYVESGGKSQIVSSAQAVGVVQMMPGTARQYGLRVDGGKSWRLRRKIASKGENPQLLAELMRVDERFDPYKCIRGGARYLRALYERYGSWDFAVSAYFTGGGHVNGLIRHYIAGAYPDLGIRRDVEEYALSFNKIFFGSSPRRNPLAYQWFKDNPLSTQYWWNVEAASRAIKLSRRHPRQFRQKVFQWKNLTASRRYELIPEIVWYPRGTKTFSDVWEIKRAWEKGQIVKAPEYPEAFGFILDKGPEGIGVHADPSVQKYFFGSRPETVGLLMTIAYLVRDTSGQWDKYLSVTSLIRSEAYQRRLVSTGHSIHAVGRTLDVSTSSEKITPSQLRALKFALARLKVMGDITYAKEGTYAYHVTLNPRSVAKYRDIYEAGMQFLASQ